MSKEFEQKAQEFFLKRDGLNLTKPFPIKIGFGIKQKNHNFDLGSEQPKILIECKKHTWTKGGNVPSAKISVWNEAMLYFSMAPSTYRKIFFVLKSEKDGQSLAQYYVRAYSHLVPPGVEIWEYDQKNSVGHYIYPGNELSSQITNQRLTKRKTTRSTVGKLPGIEDFKEAINSLFENTHKKGQKILRIKAGDLHEMVVGSRSNPNRMPICCSAMYHFCSSKDKVIYSPPKGKGANLEIEYKIQK